MLSCGHVGDIFGKIGGDRFKVSCVRCCVVVFFEFLGVWAEFGPDFLHIFEVWVSIFDAMRAPFGRQYAALYGLVGIREA